METQRKRLMAAFWLVLVSCVASPKLWYRVVCLAGLYWLGSRIRELSKKINTMKGAQIAVDDLIRDWATAVLLGQQESVAVRGARVYESAR